MRWHLLSLSFARHCQLVFTHCVTGRAIHGHPTPGNTLWLAHHLHVMMDGAVHLRLSRGTWKLESWFTRWFETTWQIWFVNIARLENCWAMLTSGETHPGHQFGFHTSSSWTWTLTIDNLHGQTFQVGRKTGILRTEIQNTQKELFLKKSIVCILFLSGHQLAPAGSFAYATSGGQFVCHSCTSYRPPRQKKSWPNACWVGEGIAPSIPPLPQLVQTAWHPSIEFALQLEPLWKGVLDSYAWIVDAVQGKHRQIHAILARWLFEGRTHCGRIITRSQVLHLCFDYVPVHARYPWGVVYWRGGKEHCAVRVWLSAFLSKACGTEQGWGKNQLQDSAKISLHVPPLGIHRTHQAERKVTWTSASFTLNGGILQTKSPLMFSFFLCTKNLFCFGWSLSSIQAWTLLPRWKSDGSNIQDRKSMPCKHNGANMFAPLPCPVGPLLGVRAFRRIPSLSRCARPEMKKGQRKQPHFGVSEWHPNKRVCLKIVYP